MLDTKNYSENNLNNNFALQMAIIPFMAFYVLWQMPIVAIYMNTYVAMIILVVSFILVVFATRYYRVPLTLTITMLVYMLLSFLIFEFRGMSILNNVWSQFLIFWPIVIGIQIVLHKLDWVVKITVPLIIITQVITIITTYLGLEIFPEASRLLATGQNVDLYYRYNIGGFSFIYSLAILHPIVVGILRIKGRNLLCVLYTVITALCVFRSAYTLAALLFIISCVAYVLPLSVDKRKIKNRMVLIVICLILVLVFIPTILDSLARWDLLEGSSSKIQDIANIFRGEETQDNDTSARMSAYMESFEAIWDSAFMGSVILNGKEQSGGHSFILDYIANWGILGIGIIASLYGSFHKVYKHLSAKKEIYGFVILSLVLSFVLAIVNPKFDFEIFGLMIPFMIRYVSMENR